MISVFDMASSELLHREHPEKRRTSGCDGVAGRHDIDGRQPANAPTPRHERELLPRLELRLLPVE